MEDALAKQKMTAISEILSTNEDKEKLRDSIRCVFESIDNQNKLRQDRTYMDYFAFIADAIISHNIWFNMLGAKRKQKNGIMTDIR